MVDFNTEATMSEATIGKDIKLVNTGIDDEGIEWEADPVTFVNDGKGVTPSDGYVLVPDGAYLQLDISDLDGFVNPADPENPYIGTYSVFWDIKLPKIGTYYCLLQTNPWNSTDAKLCINGSGKLGSGFLQRYNSDWTAKADTWYRVGATFHQPDGYYALFVDGKCIEDGTSGNVEKIGGRFALEKEGLLFFADEDGEDTPINCSKAMFFDRNLSAEEVATLGDPRTIIEAAGVNDVIADEDANAPVEYFNLQGVSVSAENLVPGLYISRQGKTVKKVVVK